MLMDAENIFCVRFNQAPILWRDPTRPLLVRGRIKNTAKQTKIASVPAYFTLGKNQWPNSNGQR
ncbi:MAG: hypothetical protein J6Y94_05250 [Bacteriovoracaceae bacterium]|nr:hypothetical protein [Bacteriovoracaceae bacterium]